jgi:hypothetical protein
MCGIVGYVGQRPVQEILLEGLQKLEYRGYDSAGISIQSDGQLDSVRAVGNLSALRAAVDGTPSRDFGGAVAVAAPPATTGIGHTRWATHGRVSEENAHPHFDSDNRVHIVVNGIVENYMELKQELLAAGAEFTSETDVEVMAHLIARELEETGVLTEAVRLAGVAPKALGAREDDLQRRPQVVRELGEQALADVVGVGLPSVTTDSRVLAGDPLLGALEVGDLAALGDDERDAPVDPRNGRSTRSSPAPYCSRLAALVEDELA